MRRFFYLFLTNLIALTLILVYAGIMLFLLVTPYVLGKTNLIPWFCGIVIILIVLIPTMGEFLEPEKYIKKFVKLITKYEED